jgi:hypothetical protein
MECFLCVKQDINPPAEGSLCTGQRYSYYHEKWIVFRGHVCDMHLNDDCRGVRYLPEASNSKQKVTA